MISLQLGDCLGVMGVMESNSVDSVITDPPYGLSFMGKRWDYEIPSVGEFAEMLRIAKPGAILMCFGGTRTWHRIAVNIEDAGWEIRDTLMWLYGQGFPKSLNVGKAIDKTKGLERKVVGVKPGHEDFIGRKTKGHIDFKNGTEGFDRPWMHDEEKREAYHFETAPASPEGELWDGWGSALKPAFEPIVMAMKPLDGTYAENALKWGVAGINIDGGRVPTEETVTNHSRGGEAAKSKGIYGDSEGQETHQTEGQKRGRFPANVILDEDVGSILDIQSISSAGVSRFFYCAKASQRERNEGLEGFETKKASSMPGRRNPDDAKWDTGNDVTSRFVTEKKNIHPTVKPLALMEYLCVLTKTPTGGIVFDPYMGSGTTGVACRNTGRDFIGIERDPEYFNIAEARVGGNVKKRMPL